MSNVVVVDNGGGLIKAGTGGNLDPTVVLPNCSARPLSSKKHLIPTVASDHHLTSAAALRRPLDRGYLTHPDLQSHIWQHLFSSLLHVSPTNHSLLLVEPLLTPPSVQRSTDELVFEEFGFRSLFVADPPALVHVSRSSRVETLASLVVDCGFSFCHVAPVLQNVTLNYGVRRMDLGGKALTNYLKELVSYRSVNVMDETFLMDDVKEKLCFVSLDVDRDLKITRSRGRDNLIRCTYVLPDGVTHTKGFVNDEDEAKKYLALDDRAALKQFRTGEEEPLTPEDGGETSRKKQRADLAQNEINLTNERFLVPEMLFRPADLGLNQAGLAECIVRAVNSCHSYLHPALYESIILTGGSTLFPRFAERLERELRPLVPDNFRVKITSQEDPILGVWRGGSLLASSPDFENMCVTKAEYEELGSARCRRRFFR